MKPTDFLLFDISRLANLLGLAALALCMSASAADEPIAIDAHAATDTAIEDRISTIFAEIDGLEDLKVSVNVGVVDLTGTLMDADLRDQAMSIANRTEGTVAVQDHTEVTNQIQPRIENAIEQGSSRLSTALSYLPLLLIAVVVIFAFSAIAKIVWSRDALFSRYVANVFIRNLLRQLAGALVILIGLLIALELLNATAIVGAVLGAAGVVGLAIGFAFRDTIENYIAGILLSIRQPFALHDHVAVEGHEGYVARLTSRATVLVTLDGNYVRIPNAKVFQGILLNYSRNPLRRFDFTLGIGTDVDIAAAQELARETLSEMEGVINDPPPQAVVDALGDSNVIIIIKAWVDQREVDFSKVRSEAIRQIKQRFENAEFDMPEPIYRLRIATSAGRLLGDNDHAPGPEERSKTHSTDKPVAAHVTIEADVSPDMHMIQQVEDERRRTSSEDLLDQSAPQE